MTQKFFGYATTVLYLVDGGLRLIKLLRGGAGIRIIRRPANPQQPTTQTNTQPNYWLWFFFKAYSKFFLVTENYHFL